MRKNILLLAILLIPVFVFGQEARNGDSIQYFRNTKYIRLKTTYKNGVKNGLEEEYQSPKELKKRMYYVDGKLHGKYEEYSWGGGMYHGKLIIEGNYINGKKNGLWKNYYERWAAEFKDDLKNGNATGFYYDSTIAYKSFFVNDKIDGLHESWYNNGKPKYIINYKLDKMHGQRKHFYENGKLAAEGNYVEDKPNGLFRFYDQESGKLVHEANFKNGNLHGKEFEWDKDGKLIRRSNYTNNFPDSTTEFGNTENGNFRKLYLKGIFSENWLWNTKGRLIKHRKDVNDSLYCDTAWYNNGKIHFVHIPDLKTNTQKYIAWYENGKKEKEGQLKSARRNGVWTFYSAQGEISKEEYKEGKLIKKNSNNQKLTYEEQQKNYSAEGEEQPLQLIGSIRSPQENAFDMQIFEEGLPLEYSGGDSAMNAFIAQRLYGEKGKPATGKKVKFHITVGVDKYGNGRLMDNNIPTEDYLEKIIKAVSEMKWKPAMRQGKYEWQSRKFEFIY